MSEKYYVYDRIEEMYWASGGKEFADKRKNAAVYDIEEVKNILKTSKREVVIEPVNIFNKN